MKTLLLSMALTLVLSACTGRAEAQITVQYGYGGPVPYGTYRPNYGYRSYYYHSYRPNYYHSYAPYYYFRPYRSYYGGGYYVPHQAWGAAPGAFYGGQFYLY